MLLILFGLLNIFVSIQCANILGYFPSHSVSHHMTFRPVYRELALRGHNVTIITTFPFKDPHLTNLTEIDMGFQVKSNVNVTKGFSSSNTQYGRMSFLFELCRLSLKEHFENEEIHQLLRSNIKFDVVLLQALCPLVYAVAGQVEAPIIAISSFGVLLQTHDSIGNPTHPLLFKDMILTDDGPPTFFIKVNNFLYHIWYRVLYYWYFLPQADKLAREYFGNDIPYLGDVENNVSLVLVTENSIMNTVRPNVPNIIEIGQVHIKEKQPLPKDLQDYLDNSPQGVIYLSFGSNVKSANLSENLRNTILGALSELSYDVLWKWEADSLPGQPKNVLTRKWLPQQDLLGHPNIKAFVTQGGYQSIEEAIYNQVPMVGMPFMSDQPGNVQKLVDLGMGMKIDYNTVTKEQLISAILEVAQNKKYKESVIRTKSILEDQPIKGLEKAIWWIEYVIRHNGAPHLKSPAAYMSFYEYFMLDVVIFLLSVLLTTTVIIYYLIKMTLGILRGTKHVKVKVN